jgi:hypothetical protein
MLSMNNASKGMSPCPIEEWSIGIWVAGICWSWPFPMPGMASVGVGSAGAPAGLPQATSRFAARVSVMRSIAFIRIISLHKSCIA